MTIRIKRGRNILDAREFWWTLNSSNGQIIATSEIYNSHWSCKKTANRVAKAMGITLRPFK